MKINACREFKLEPAPASLVELADQNQLRAYIENSNQAIILLLQEVAKLRDEVNTLRGL